MRRQQACRGLLLELFEMKEIISIKNLSGGIGKQIFDCQQVSKIENN